jgi:hypothetical protein
MKRRIVMLLSVVALMVVMLAMSVAPGWAHFVTCTGGQYVGSYSASYAPEADKDQDGVICGRSNPKTGDIRFFDDHGFPNGH